MNENKARCMEQLDKAVAEIEQAKKTNVWRAAMKETYRFKVMALVTTTMELTSNGLGLLSCLANSKRLAIIAAAASLASCVLAIYARYKSSSGQR